MFVLLTSAKAVASLTLQIHIPGVEPGGQVASADKVTSVRRFVEHRFGASNATPKPIFVRVAQSDELAEHLIQLRLQFRDSSVLCHALAFVCVLPLVSAFRAPRLPHM